MSGPYSLVHASPIKLHSATTTGNGGVLMLYGQCARATIVLQSNGTTSGGAVSIEESFNEGNASNPGLQYSGTWSVIQAVNAADFTGTAQKVIHVTGSVWALRVRVSSDITGGGSITVWAYGN